MMKRRLCAAILSLQAIVLGLTTPVLIAVESIDRTPALVLGLGLTSACLLAAGMLRGPVGYALGWGVQAGSIALGVQVPVMYALGGIFLALWITALRLGSTIDRDRAAAEPAPDAD